MNENNLVPSTMLTESALNQNNTSSNTNLANQNNDPLGKLELKSYSHSMIVSGGQNNNLPTPQSKPTTTIPSKRGRPRMDSKLSATPATPD